MAETLPREFQQLQLTEISSSSAGDVTPKVKKTRRPIEMAPDSMATHFMLEPDPPKPAHRHLARYPPVPRIAFTGERYYFFGWRFSPEEMTRRADKLAQTEKFDYWHGGGSGNYVAYLMEKSGYDDMRLVFALPEDVTFPVDITCFKEGGLCAGIGLSATRSKRTFWKRPSQAQMEILRRLVGEEPTWFKDGMPKEYFVDYAF